MDKLLGSISVHLAIFVMFTVSETEDGTNIGENTESIFVAIFEKPVRVITIQLKFFKMLVYKF